MSKVAAVEVCDATTAEESFIDGSIKHLYLFIAVNKKIEENLLAANTVVDSLLLPLKKIYNGCNKNNCE